MTKTDKNEIQVMLDAAISHLNQIRKLENENIANKLDSLILQTTIANETLKDHGDKINTLERMLPHTAENCPHKNKMDLMWEDRLTNNGVKKRRFSVVTLLGGIIAGIVGAIAIFEYIFNHSK